MTRWLAPLLACAAGCAASSSPNVVPGEPGFVPAPCAASPPDCVSGEQVLCRGDSGYDRVRAAVFFDEHSTGVLSVPEPGTICMTGTMPAVGSEESPWNMLWLTVDERTNGGTCVRTVLDARALGIKSFDFELDQVPPTRMYIEAGMILQAECDDRIDCEAGYTLLTHDRQDLVFPQAGTNTALLADFVSDDGDTPFDTSRVAWFGLRMEPTEMPIDASYCVSGLRFLDAAGRQVELP